MPSTPSLDYAPTPPLHHRQSFFKWIAGLVLLAMVIAAIWWVPSSWLRIQILFWERRCLGYVPPPGQLIYDSTTATGVIPREWSNFYTLFSPPGFSSKGTVFLHEMNKPDGQSRLVAVDIASDGNFTSRTFTAGNLYAPPQELATTHQTFVGDISKSMQVFAGGIDPADATHFSFRTIEAGKEKVCDGWLQNDEQVTIGQHQ